LTGEVDEPAKGCRGICYCRDCQAYAHALGNASAVLDPLGGTDVVATLPKRVRIATGADALACLSLTDRGMLRWYASCCRTPIANTMSDFRFPYAGLVHSCLGSPDAIEAAFGPVRMRVNTKSARAGNPKPMPLSQAATLARLLPSVLFARLDGSYRTTPFFTRDGRPRAERRVLTPDELAAARTGA
jgi:hypothetical protein